MTDCGEDEAKHHPACEHEPRDESVAPAMLGLTQGYIVQRTILPDFDEDAYLTGIDCLMDATAAGRVQA